MSIIQALILGIIEGATEFLPISSTGHLILASSLLGILQSDFTKTFEIAIQLGAIAAVGVYFFKTFFDWQLLFKLAAAFIPTGLIGLLVYPFFRAALEGNELVVLISLFVGGAILILFERYHGKVEDWATPKPPREVTWREAVLIGFAQAVAIIPGVSRSGATIVGGLALGLARETIVEFSFLLAVPTMLVATLYSLYKGSALAFSAHEWLALTVGFIAAFVVALAVIRWFLTYIRSHSFASFGVYRIALSLVFLAWLFL